MEQWGDSILRVRPIAPTVLRAISAQLNERASLHEVTAKIRAVPFYRGIKLETSPAEMAQDDFEPILKTIDDLARKFRLSIVEQTTGHEDELFIVLGNFA